MTCAMNYPVMIVTWTLLMVGVLKPAAAGPDR